MAHFFTTTVFFSFYKKNDMLAMKVINLQMFLAGLVGEGLEKSQPW